MSKRKTKPKKAARETKATEPIHPHVADAPSPTKRRINDQRGEAPVLGHFVDVISGPHKGRYGVFDGLAADPKTAIVRTRDSASECLSIPLKNLTAAEAGRR